MHSLEDIKAALGRLGLSEFLHEDGDYLWLDCQVESCTFRAVFAIDQNPRGPVLVLFAPNVALVPKETPRRIYEVLLDLNAVATFGCWFLVKRRIGYRVCLSLGGVDDKELRRVFNGCLGAINKSYPSIQKALLAGHETASTTRGAASTSHELQQALQAAVNREDYAKAEELKDKLEELKREPEET